MKGVTMKYLSYHVEIKDEDNFDVG